MLKQRSLLLEEHSALIVRMRDAQQLRDVLDLIPRLDVIEQEVGRASEPIAFKGRGCGQKGHCAYTHFPGDPTLNPTGVYSFYSVELCEKNECKQKRTLLWPIFKNKFC